MGIFEYEIIALIFILWLIIHPLLIFLPWYAWWNKLDSTSEKCFSLATLAYYKYNYPLYLIYNDIFTTGPSRMKEDYWVEFLNGIMSSQAYGIVPGGLCTPKTLCTSLIPTEYPIDPLPSPFFSEWPKTVQDWRGLILSWMGMTTPPSSPSEYKPNFDIWNSRVNFLNDWGISPNSPIVVGFVTGLSNWGDDKVYPTAILPLLGFPAAGGSGQDFGGWFGFINAGDPWSNGGLNEINRAIWSSEPTAQGKKVQNRKPPCDTAGVAAGAIGSGVAFGAMGGMALGPPGAIIGAIAGAIVGALTGAVGGHCL